MPEEPQEFLTTKEAAQMLRISPLMFAAFAKNMDIRPMKYGKKTVRWSVAVVEAMKILAREQPHLLPDE